MNVLETEWWTMVVPPEWWAEADGDSILVGDQDDVGCIEISTLVKESGEFDQESVANIAAAEAEEHVDWSPARLGEFTGVCTSFTAEDAAIREWYLFNGTLLLFVTYSCAADNAGMDDAAVDEILDTLLLTGEG